MQQFVDFCFGIGLSSILIIIYFVLLWKWPKWKILRLYFYNIVTFGLFRFINENLLLPVF